MNQVMCDKCNGIFPQAKTTFYKGQYLCDNCLLEKIKEESKPKKNVFFGQNIKEAINIIKNIFKR